MEDALAHVCVHGSQSSNIVLILVLMEDALALMRKIDEYYNKIKS